MITTFKYFDKAGKLTSRKLLVTEETDTTIAGFEEIYLDKKAAARLEKSMTSFKVNSKDPIDSLEKNDMKAFRKYTKAKMLERKNS